MGTQSRGFICWFQVQRGIIYFFILMVFGVCDILSSDFEPGGKPEVEIINPNAEVVIGSVLNIRQRGSGLFGCGERNKVGVIYADSLKWMVDELNSKLWSGSSANVSLGLHIMDSCGRSRTATSQLVNFLPELQVNEKSTRALPFKACVIDGVGLKDDLDIIKSLEDIDIAIVDTNINPNSGPVILNAVFLFVQEFRWERFNIVHSNSKYSASMVKYLIKSAKKFEFCVSQMINVEEENITELENTLKSKIPIISLLPSEEHDAFLKRLQNETGYKKKVPLVFSDMVTREQLKMIPANSFRVFSVISYPEKEKSFENFFAKNSIEKGIRAEDELDLIERTQEVRKIKRIGEKISESLKTVVERVCREKEKLCLSLFSSKGRSAIKESLSKAEWAKKEQLYQLVEYLFQFSDGHVHLHKVMALNGHNNLEIFENSFTFPDYSCDKENDSPSECRCLEVKTGRVGLARNIDDWHTRNSIGFEKNLSNSQVQDVAQSPTEPMVYATLSDPLNGTLACLTLLGSLLTLVIIQYFATFAALPNGGLTTGTSIIGYVILIGLFLLFSTNLSFLLTPLATICGIRRFGPALSYAMIFSGMLIKIWIFLRQSTSDKAKTPRPITLFIYSGAFTLFQSLISGLWLVLRPPNTEYTEGHWICYPPENLDSPLILSMIAPISLLLVTIFLAIRACSKGNNDEVRWILISSALVAIIMSFWSVAIGTGVWKIHRTPSTNLAAATILLVCLYFPKIKMHTKLKKTIKAQAKCSAQLPSIAKECSVLTRNSTFPVVLGYNMATPAPVLPELIDPNYINQAYSIDESSETASTPFDIDLSSYSELEQESPYTFSTFLEEPQTVKLDNNNVLDDPTQVIPSALYPLEMFNNEPIAITSDHCQPGTNEFTPPHRATSQLYLCPQSAWIP